MVTSIGLQRDRPPAGQLRICCCARRQHVAQRLASFGPLQRVEVAPVDDHSPSAAICCELDEDRAIATDIRSPDTMHTVYISSIITGGATAMSTLITFITSSTKLSFCLSGRPDRRTEFHLGTVPFRPAAVVVHVLLFLGFQFLDLFFSQCHVDLSPLCISASCSSRPSAFLKPRAISSFFNAYSRSCANSSALLSVSLSISWYWLRASCAHHRLRSAVLHDTIIGAAVRLRTYEEGTQYRKTDR